MDGGLPSIPVRMRGRVDHTRLGVVLGASEDPAGFERNVQCDAADGHYGGLEGLCRMCPGGPKDARVSGIWGALVPV